MFYTSGRISGTEAYAMGLADVLVPQDQVRAAAMALAIEIAENAPLGLLATRATMRGDLADRVRRATEHELGEQTRLRKTDDFKEGVKAVSERRVPKYKGRGPEGEKGKSQLSAFCHLFCAVNDQQSASR